MPILSTDININPEMKFRPETIGVVESPEVYRYSLRKELNRASRDYDRFVRYVDKQKLENRKKKHPTMAKALWGAVKVALSMGAIYCAIRYRHSIPLIKSLCKPPKTPPPSFKNDIKSLFGKK